ncbi:MAG: hypothetical protein ABFD60_01675 [Bryobacteraceae bacterium]
MAFENQQLRVPGLVAGEDLSAAAVQFKFVYLSGDRTVKLCDSATIHQPIGVLQAPAATSALGEPVSVCALGITKLQADESLAAGELIGTSADGQAAHYTPGGDITKYPVGQVIEVAGGTTATNLITAAIDCLTLRRAA